MLVLALAACLRPATPEPTDEPVPTDDTAAPTPLPPPLPTQLPPVTADRLTVLGHAQECAQVLGPVPGFDCLTDTNPVPVTVDGVQAITSPSSCDKPSLLESSCNIWTRAGRKQGTWEDGTPRPEVQFVFTCRSSDVDEPTEEGGIYHDVAMIGHNSLTGATCYFQSFPDERIRYFPSPMTADAEPDLGTTPAEDVWLLPQDTANIRCQRCHSADPWIHSPWVDQVKNPQDPTDDLVPWTEGNHTGYHVVGYAFRHWELEYFDLPDNACTTCHRIGTGGCNRFLRYSAGDATSMPLSATTEGVPWMPPGFGGTGAAWEATYRLAVEELVSCCDDPDQPACNTTATPEGYRYVDPTAPPPTPPPDTGIVCGDPDADVGSAFGQVFSGSTCGAGHDFTRSCGEVGTNSEDLAFTWTAPAAGAYTFDTFGSQFDTTLSIRETCANGDEEVACNDDANGGQQSQLTATFAAGETAVLVLDAWRDECGMAVLNVTGP